MGAKLFEQVRAAPIQASRTVSLSQRTVRETPKARQIYPARRERIAHLVIRASEVTIKRSGYLDGRRDIPRALTLNLVHVSEENPPKGEPAVEWFLFTTLTVDTTEQACEVVDIYRARWLIEELFKSLKTGCQYERLQLASYEALLRALAIYLPVAWSLLRLRYLSGVSSADTPAKEMLNQTQIAVLRAMAPVQVSPEPSLREALLAVAALGGHIPNNGEPGWQVLGRGLHDLIQMERAWRAAQASQK